MKTLAMTTGVVLLGVLFTVDTMYTSKCNDAARMDSNCNNLMDCQHGGPKLDGKTKFGDKLTSCNLGSKGACSGKCTVDGYCDGNQNETAQCGQGKFCSNGQKGFQCQTFKSAKGKCTPQELKAKHCVTIKDCSKAGKYGNGTVLVYAMLGPSKFQSCIIFNNDGFCDGDCDYDGGCTVGLNSDKQCGSGKSCDGAHCSGTMPVQKP